MDLAGAVALALQGHGEAQRQLERFAAASPDAPAQCLELAMGDVPISPAARHLVGL